MTNKKKEWICPLCPQTCGRHWNFKVHINRWHPELNAGKKTQEDDFSLDQTGWDGGISTPHVDVGKMAYLATASNPDLMRWAAIQNRLARPVNIEKWIKLFEANEDNYMMKPNTMLADMRDYFGEKPGEVIFSNFVQLRNLKDYHRKETQPIKNSSFPIPQLQGHPNRKVQETKRYFLGHEDIQPNASSSMPYYHYMMQRSIEQIEEDEREKKMRKLREEDRVRDAFETYLRALYFNQRQNYSGQGNNTADPLILIKDLVDTGKMVPVPSLDANGNKIIRYELSPLWQSQNCNVHHNHDVAIISKIVEDIYEKNTEIILRCIDSRGGMKKMGMNLSKSTPPLEANSTGTQQLRAEQSRPESDIISLHQKETVEPRDKIEQEKIKQAIEDEQFVWGMQKMQEARILEKQISDRRA